MPKKTAQTPALIPTLEEHFRRITTVLYDTRVSVETLDEEVLPYLDENVLFTDPWQQAAGKAKYRLGAAGFHAMFSFEFEIRQLNVQLQPGDTRGRALVDGVMFLRRLRYPLRTLLAYDFELEPPGRRGAPVRFRITAHEEMWSFGDMLEAVPLAGRVYGKLFRRGFSYAFLAASYVSCRLRGMLPPSLSQTG